MKILTKILNNLLKINHDENQVRNYIKVIFKKNNIKFYEDEFGNLYNFDYQNNMFLSSHMDTVKRNQTLLLEENEISIKSNSILGGDDSCGVAIILTLLFERKLKFNWILTSREEIGGIGSKYFLKNNKQLLENQNFGLILDRKGNSDIICTYNEYGGADLEKALLTIGKKYNYKSAMGVWSDCDRFREATPCANISVGYYNQHTEKEYIVYEDLYKAYQYTKDIIINLQNTQFSKIQNQYEIYCELCGEVTDDLIYVSSIQQEMCKHCARNLILEIDYLLSKEIDQDNWWNDSWYSQDENFL
jgi:putative aminopeptidase FrvX